MYVINNVKILHCFHAVFPLTRKLHKLLFLKILFSHEYTSNVANENVGTSSERRKTSVNLHSKRVNRIENILFKKVCSISWITKV